MRSRRWARGWDGWFITVTGLGAARLQGRRRYTGGMSVDVTAPGYLGRFAPSPTGPLHFGSLVAAVGSYLDARHHAGAWAVRIDDLDRTRSVAGAADHILRTLEAFSLEWHGPVVRQTDRDPAYRDALDRLIAAGWAYGCACTRRQVQATGRAGAAGVVYPGTCRGGIPGGRPPRTYRVLTENARVSFTDLRRGTVACDLERDIGDFLVRRGDGLFAYHLACVVDDAALGASHVVRGGDLLDCTAPQILLAQLLELPTPDYLHLPVAVNATGTKLSKQTGAAAVDAARPGPVLSTVLAFLGHPPPAELTGAPPAEQLAWAVEAWDRGRIPEAATVPAPGD